jgi:hypothetical protein
MLGKLPRPEVILTHESDLDGLLAGVLLSRLARKLFDADVKLEAYHYNYWKQRELRERSAWVTDFGFESRLDRPNWVVIDHHPTEVPARNAYLIHDVTKSAASLCYELCQIADIQSPALDRLVHLNNVADLFLENDPDFILACDYANLVKSYGFWNLHALTNGALEKLLDHPLLEVMTVKRQVEDPLGLAWSRENISALTPQVGFVNTIVGNNNLIVHQLLEQGITSFPVLVTLFRKSNGLVVASFRSKNGEAGKVAERVKGGGHPNASGAILPKHVRTIPDAVDFLKQALNPTTKRSEGLTSLEGIFAALDQVNRKG